MESVLNIIKAKEKFPCKLNKFEGETLKQHFILDENSINKQEDKKDISYKYYQEIEGVKYILIEEYMFRVRETVLDIKRAIGVNYYLNKDSKNI